MAPDLNTSARQQSHIVLLKIAKICTKYKLNMTGVGKGIIPGPQLFILTIISVLIRLTSKQPSDAYMQYADDIIQ